MLKAKADQDKEDILNDLSFEIKEAVKLSQKYTKLGSLVRLFHLTVANSV